MPMVVAVRDTKAELWDTTGPQREPVYVEIREGQVFNPRRVVWEPGFVRLEMHHSLLLSVPDRDVRVSA